MNIFGNRSIVSLMAFSPVSVRNFAIPYSA